MIVVTMLRNGADSRYIEELLRHARLETTQIYTRILPTELRSIRNQFHPRERSKDSVKAYKRRLALSFLGDLHERCAPELGPKEEISNSLL